MENTVDLFQNPFHILTVTTRDNQERIMELADEHSLLLDANECIAARLVLTTPRKRLAAEVAWLPGIGPKRAEEVISLLESCPKDMFAKDNLPPAARANALATALVRLPEYRAENIAKWILELAEAFEEIDSEKLKNMINEERIVAEFPEITDISAIEERIQEQRRYYRHVIKAALDNLTPEELVAAVTDAVESATDVGEKYCPILIADIVDAYEVDEQEFLDKEEKNILALSEKLQAAVDANSTDSVLEPMVTQLIQVVKDWDLVAQPIQVSTKSRGLNHDASLRVAKTLRNLAIYMFNEHGKLELSQRFTNTLQEVFAEVVEIAERTAEDGKVLDNLAEHKKLAVFLAPIDDLLNATFAETKKYPADIRRAAEKLIRQAPALLGMLYSADVPDDIVREKQESIAMLLIYCAIEYGNKTSQWEECIKILEEADTYTHDVATEQRIAVNIRIARNNKENKSEKLKDRIILFGIIAVVFVIWLYGEYM
jgi:hypothetical protein